MTGRDVRTARATLGQLYGLGRPLKAAELGRLLRMPGRDPGRSVLYWEDEKYPVSGPALVALEALLGGFRPEHFAEAFRNSATAAVDEVERLQTEVERLRKLERAFMDGSLKGV